MADDDHVIADKDLFDDQAHDALALDDVERVRSTTQSSKKPSEGFGEAQKCRTLGRLVGDRLLLGT